MTNLNERPLPDDYPVHAGYAYVADGKPIISDISGCVLQLKSDVGASEVTNYDMFGRESLSEKGEAQ